METVATVYLRYTDHDLWHTVTLRDIDERSREWDKIEHIKANDLAYRVAMFMSGKHPDTELEKPKGVSNKEMFNLL